MGDEDGGDGSGLVAAGEDEGERGGDVGDGMPCSIVRSGEVSDGG